MALAIKTAPALEPLTLVEMKEALHIEHALDDARLAQLMRSARRRVEILTGRALVTQVWYEYFDAFDPVMRPHRSPLATVDALSYVDGGGVTETLTEGTDFDVDKVTAPARIRPCHGVSWPATRAVANAVTLEFTAGYGLPPAVPEELSDAIVLLVGTAYTVTEATSTGGDRTRALAHAGDFWSLIADHIVHRW